MIVQTSTTCNPRQLVLEFLQMQAQSAEKRKFVVVLEFLQMQATTKIKINSESITSFQENVAKSFVTDLKGNISRRFSFQDIVASFSIFDPSKLPQNDSPDLGKNSLVFLRTTMARNLQPNQ